MQSSVQVLWVTIHHRSDYFELWGFVIWSIVRFLWTYKSCHCWKYPGRLDLRILQHIEEELWFGCGLSVNSWGRLLSSGGNLKVENDKKITVTVSLILIHYRRRLRNNHYLFTKNLYQSQPWSKSCYTMMDWESYSMVFIILIFINTQLRNRLSTSSYIV